MVTTDLHLHTYYSDGNESPSRVVERAAKLGYKTIAITDHEGVMGIAEAEEAGKELGIRVVPGIEFDVEYTLPDLAKGGDMVYGMHILGYGIDPENKFLKDEMARCIKARDERNKKLIEWFSSIGIEMTEEELYGDSPNKFIGRQSFANLLVKRGLCADADEAARSSKYLGNKEAKAIHKKKMDAGYAIELLGKAGGYSVMAHPYQLKYPGKNMESAQSLGSRIEFVASCLAGEGLFGIEAYYPNHTEEQVKRLLSVADYFGLRVSRGSDDHGEGARKVMKMSEFAVEADEKRLAWISK